MTNCFDANMREKFHATKGAYTEMTFMELTKSTYNVKAVIRDLIIDCIGVDNVPVAGKTDNQTIKFLMENGAGTQEEVFLQCKFSKVNKREMTIYFDKRLTENLAEGDIWYVYERNNLLYIGFETRERWKEWFPYVFTEELTEKKRKESLETDSQLLDKVKTEEDSYSDDSLYNISSYGTDLTFREIVSMYNDGDIEKPEMQRKYVWTKNEASRFIDSVLLGLPVPSIFLAKTEDKRMLIVDGYQRIMTMYDYMERGIFGGDGKSFKLSSTKNIHDKWRGKTYQELTEEQRRAIRTFPIHAIIFEQKQPKDDTGMYQIFERINTSGRVLKPQEIRNCVYHGKFNSMLCDLNREIVWRSVIGSEIEDSRMADIELILRFFAFVDFPEESSFSVKQINLTKFMNEYMNKAKRFSDEEIQGKKELFIDTIEYLYSAIGETVFRTGKIKNGETVWAKKINPVVFDAVCTAAVRAGMPDVEVGALMSKYEELVANEEFLQVTKARTTNIENIEKRVDIAQKILFGED